MEARSCCGRSWPRRSRPGARLAEPGEFTLRAFLNGRIDLMQAEAVADLIDAVTPLQARAAFDQLHGTLTRAIAEIDAALFDLIARLEASVDFPEEGYHFVEPGALAQKIDAVIDRTRRLLADAERGRLVREGFQVAIVGKPNVGKSSVFNALVGAARAIVTDVPGTTRDLVTEVVDFDGLRVTLVDTAGLRDTTDCIEAEGVERARQAQAVADLTLVVLDGAAPLDDSDRQILSEVQHSKRLIVCNKSDLEPAWSDADVRRVSARTYSAGFRNCAKRSWRRSMRPRCGTRPRSPTSATVHSFNAHRTRWFARAAVGWRRTEDRSQKSSCSRICRRRARRSKRSWAGAQAKICSRIFSRASVSENKTAEDAEVAEEEGMLGDLAVSVTP